MSSVWQQLGAFVYTGKNLSNEQLDRFAGVGGKWIVPVVYNDSAAGPWNLGNIETLKALCAPRDIRVGGWFNYMGEDAALFAANVAGIVHAHNIGPVVLDCEAPVQGNTKLSSVALEIRKQLPTRSIGVSTNSLNDAAVYNGRIGSAPAPADKSFRDLGIRVLPQWYNAPAYGRGTWTQPDANMKWLKDPTGSADNLFDPDAPYGRAVPLSYVHGVLEVTGNEDATLADELAQLERAKGYGYTLGFSLYTLEKILATDWPLIAAVRGRLYV